MPEAYDDDKLYGWMVESMHTSHIECLICHAFTQSFAKFRWLLWFLLPIVLYHSLLFYRPLLWYYRLLFVLTQLATCPFTPVICTFRLKTWPRRFAWFTINQWKLAILRYGWRISSYKLSMTLPRFYHPSI